MVAMPIDSSTMAGDTSASSTSSRAATPEEIFRLLDRRAQRYLGISGREFLCRWNGGYYARNPDQPGVIDLAMLVPFTQEPDRA